MYCMNFTEKDVAIVVPLSSRPELSNAEKISLHHIMVYLGKYDKYFLAPQSLNLTKINNVGFTEIRFPDKFFGSVRAHNRLMTTKEVYEPFTKYQYILVIHLDALVLSDQLLEWCEKGYDFVAPPWIKTELDDWLEDHGIGNGGFSLRKVKSFIRLYSMGRYWLEPKEMAHKFSRKFGFFSLPVYLISLIIFRMKIFNNVRIHLKRFIDISNRGEDRFISLHAKHYCPDFKIPSIQEALAFAFEVNPRKCFELNNHKLPFGCHAFESYDFSFWEPHILHN
jgi:hypothetical protein